jgi:hypothetical protein
MAVTQQPTYDFPMPNSTSIEDKSGKRHVVTDYTSLTKVLRRMQQDLNTLSGRSNNMKAQGPTDMGGYHVKGAVNSPSPTSDELVTYGLLQAVASPAALRKAISILGQTQLNVQGMHGLLADPQTPLLTVPGNSGSIKKSSGSDLVSFVGQIQYLTGILQYWNGSAWVPITANGSLVYGTRANTPAQPQSASITYYNTDFNWEYYSNGANWIFEAGICIGTDAKRLTVTPGTGIANWSLGNPGNNYVVGDTVTGPGGSTFTVASITGALTSGPIATLTPLTAGTGCTVVNGASLTGGSGSGATINVLTLSDDGAVFITTDTLQIWAIIAGAWVNITPNYSSTPAGTSILSFIPGVEGDAGVANTAYLNTAKYNAGFLQQEQSGGFVPTPETPDFLRGY